LRTAVNFVTVVRTVLIFVADLVLKHALRRRAAEPVRTRTLWK